jgi:hypothetical protein
VKILDPLHSTKEDVNYVAKMIGDTLKEKDLLDDYAYFVTSNMELSIDQIDDFETKMKNWIKDLRERAIHQ